MLCLYLKMFNCFVTVGFPLCTLEHSSQDMQTFMNHKLDSFKSSLKVWTISALRCIEFLALGCVALRCVSFAKYRRRTFHWPDLTQINSGSVPMSKSYSRLTRKHFDWPNNFVLLLHGEKLSSLPGEIFGSREWNNESFPVKRESCVHMEQKLSRSPRSRLSTGGNSVVPGETFHLNTCRNVLKSSYLVTSKNFHEADLQ